MKYDIIFCYFVFSLFLFSHFIYIINSSNFHYINTLIICKIILLQNIYQIYIYIYIYIYINDAKNHAFIKQSQIKRSITNIRLKYFENKMKLCSIHF
jgi:hypothetical protein